MLTIKKKKARVVNKNIALIVLIFICEACTSSKVYNSTNKLYSIKQFISVDNRSYLRINFYQYGNKKKPIPAFYYINGIIFGPKDDLKFDTINVRPGIFKIKGGYVGKEETHSKINIGKRDSVVIKMYLKDSSEPLY